MRDQKYGMPPPKSRTEMEHNLFLVVEDFKSKVDSEDESLKNGAMYFTYRHLKEVVKTPNGRINMLSFNEQIRLHANTLHWMNSMQFERPENE